MILISYPSALEFWLNGTGRNDIKTPLKRENYLDQISDSIESSTLNLIPSLAPPLSIYVSSRTQRWVSKKSNKIALPANLPPNSFVRINTKVCVACPELCFVQAARFYSFANLVELGNCLCGTYVIDNECQFNQRNRKPITSVAKISKYLSNASGLHGIKAAKAALNYVQDNCGSPAESKLSAIFFLPYNRGGCGIPRGICNGEIRLSETSKNYYRGKSCRGDIVWEKKKVVFEYDSSLTHDNNNQRQFDARRQSVMNNSDYKVVRFTEDTIKGFNSFESAVLLLHKCLNSFVRENVWNKFRETRYQVFKELFRDKH